MIEHHSHHSIHGIPLQFHANHPTLAKHAEFFLKYFPSTSSNGTVPLEITFEAISHWSDFPVELPSYISAPDGHGKERVLDLEHTFGRRLFYLDYDRLVCENPQRGIRCLIQENHGVVHAYFVRPDTLEPEHQMRFLQFAISRLLKGRGYITLHATALEKHGRTVLFPGDSGRGKTTAFLALLRSGYRCLSDDHPLVHENGNGLEVLPFPEKIDVTCKTIEFFPELREAPLLLYPGMRKKFFLVEEIYPHGIGAACLPGLILFPEVVGSEESLLEPIPAKYAFDQLFRETCLSQQRDVARREFQVLSQLVRQSSCYRLLFGQDILALPKLIDPLLERD